MVPDTHGYIMQLPLTFVHPIIKLRHRYLQFIVEFESNSKSSHFTTFTIYHSQHDYHEPKG